MKTLRTYLNKSAVAAALFAGSAAHADMVTLSFGTRFGEVSPTGSGPWIQAIFDDAADPGGASSVRLSVTALDSLGDADVTQLYFNLDPAFDPTALSVDFVSVSGGSSPEIGTVAVSTGINAFQADGDGSYDILLDLPPPPGENSALFNAGETLVFDITRNDGLLSAADFYFLGAPGPGEGNPGPFLAAAHLQSTGLDGEGSDWVAAVPIPAAVWLFASALGLVGYSARRRRS